MKHLLLFALSLAIFISCTDNDPVTPTNTNKPSEYNVKIHAEGVNMWQTIFIIYPNGVRTDIRHDFTVDAQNPKLMNWDTSMVFKVGDSLAIISKASKDALVRVEYGANKLEHKAERTAGIDVWVSNE